MKSFSWNWLYLLFCLLCIINYSESIANTLPVGAEIVNQATINFQDETGITHTTTTNIVVLTIRQVYSATLYGDQTLSGISGKTVSFFHTVQNTGNGSDIYCIALNNINTDSGDFSQIRLFNDLNNNGRVDEFDPMIASTKITNTATLTLYAEQTANMIVLCDLPNTSTEDQTYELMLTIKAKQGTSTCQDNSVTDIGKNFDASNDTNHDKVIITNQAILSVTKESIYHSNGDGVFDDTIAYKVIIQNQGSRPARDIIITDLLPQFTSYQMNSIQTIHDFIATPDVDDGANGYDGSIPTHDGNTPGQISGEIDYLAVDATVSFTYILDIDDTAIGGTVLDNSIKIQGDLDDNHDTIEPEVISNKVSHAVQKTYAVQITDTGINAGQYVNNGGDDDSILNDQQYVDQVNQGETVLFTHQITNHGNSIDTFSLTILNSTFPENTVFQFRYANYSNLLLDTNSDGIPDTGVLDPNETLIICVTAVLPNTRSGIGPFVATINVQSINDQSAQDTSQDHLGAIICGCVDIANTASATGFHSEINADPANQMTTIKPITQNGLITFDLYVANEGQLKDQYQISTWMDASATVPVPNIWQISYFTEAGEILSATPPIQPGDTFHFKAQIKLPLDLSPQLIPIFFKVYSILSNTWDIKQDGIQISLLENIRMTPDNENTVTPGGSVEYVHTIQNIGNASIAVSMAVLSQSLMSHSLLLPQLFSGNEVSSYKTITNYSVGDSVVIFDYSDNQWRIISLVSDDSGGVAVPLEPKDSVRFKVRVLSPTSVSETSIDILVVQASVVGGTATATNTDRTIAASSQLQIIKAGAKDSDCSSDIHSIDSFVGAQFYANPGECIIWQLIVVNSGSETVCQITLFDKAPAFTFIHDAPVIYSQPDPGDTGVCSVNNEELECLLGNPVDINKDGVMDNYCLKAGERAEVRFRVKIE